MGLYSVMVSDGERMSLNTADAVGLSRTILCNGSDGEPMSLNTADALGLSSAILCNGK